MATILGWFFIVMGLLFLLKPEILKKRLLKKGYKKMRMFLLSLSVLLGVMMITTAAKFQGLVPKMVMVLGVIAILKGFFLLKSKAADKMIEWSNRQPLILCRVGAFVHILIGIAILNL